MSTIDPNLQEPDTGMTPLMRAVVNKDESSLRVFLADPACNPHLRNRNLNSALTFAVSRLWLKAVILLLDRLQREPNPQIALNTVIQPYKFASGQTLVVARPTEYMRGLIDGKVAPAGSNTDMSTAPPILEALNTAEAALRARCAPA